MKKHLILTAAVCLVAVMAFSFYESSRVEASDTAKEKEDSLIIMKVKGVKADVVEADSIKVKNIQLTSDDGKHKITISAGVEGVGIWLENDKGDNLMITSMKDRGVVGMVMNTKSGLESKRRMAGADAAICANGGMPFVQLRDSNDGIRMVDIATIADSVAKPDKPK